jgi:hypothetical protein
VADFPGARRRRLSPFFQVFLAIVQFSKFGAARRPPALSAGRLTGQQEILYRQSKALSTLFLNFFNFFFFLKAEAPIKRHMASEAGIA